MTLVIETGSIVTNANSYVDIAAARAYALARGVTLDADDTKVEAQLIQAMDYLESKRAEYQGCKVSATQPLQWPRTGVKIDGASFPSTEIPTTLKNAQCRLAMELQSGTDIMPTRNGGFVIREKTDVIETQYSEKIGAGVAPEMTAVEALIAPLLSGDSGFAIRTVRV